LDSTAFEPDNPVREEVHHEWGKVAPTQISEEVHHDMAPRAANLKLYQLSFPDIVGNWNRLESSALTSNECPWKSFGLAPTSYSSFISFS
jgi:hypothetical protein